MTQIRDKMNVTASWNIWGIKFKSCHPHQNKTLRNDAAALFLSVSFFVPGAVLYLSFMQAVCPDLLKLSRKNGKFFL
jgi:hypothetical protein